jgi:GLPGLI family protein
MYKCFKAIKEVLIKRKSGDLKMNVIAWYCPEIPSRFGPKDYHGLPGLIIELEDTHHIFYAEKIYLNHVNCNIENYKKNAINENEYQKIISSL